VTNPSFRMLNLIGEFTRECLTIRNGRKLKAVDVIDTHSDLFILRGVPGHISSDNGPEFIAKRSASGLPLSGRGQPTSCPAVLGRMAIARASIRSSATSCSMARSSTRWRRPGSSSKDGASTTTRSGPTHLWATDHQRRKLSHGRLATRPSFAGHPDGSASQRHPLTFKPDHPMGAGQCW
jgi:hypothetical protein